MLKQYGFIGILVGVSLLLGFIVVHGGYDVAGYVLIALTLATVVFYFVIPKTVGDEGKLFFWLLVGAFTAKAGASLFRIVWGWEVQQGRIDAGRYIRSAPPLAEALWNLQFTPVLEYLSRPGTPFLGGFYAIVYAFTGPTRLGGFLIFATLAFIGSCLFYRAFRTAFPTGNRLVFFGLIFFYPSWLYWPSGIGKDALMVFFIGLLAYGAAKFLGRGQVTGIVIAIAGIAGAFYVRPHIAALIAAGIAVSLIFRRYRLGATGILTQVVVVLVVVVLGWTVLNRAAHFVRLDELSLSAALEQYEVFQDGAKGGSAFTPVPVTHPLGVPIGIITILYRPFPWEAHRGAALVLSLEGSTLLALTIFRFRNVRAAIGAARSNPYLIFIFAYVLLSIMVFTSFGNFSIVGRQRLQFLPFFFMLLAYPSAVDTSRFLLAKQGDDAAAGAQPAIPISPTR